MFEQSIERLRAEEAAAHEHLRQASEEIDHSLPKDEILFLLQPFAAEVHRTQEALWQRLPHDELELELQRRKEVLHALTLHDPKRSLAMVAVSDLERFLHPRRPATPAVSPRRRWLVAGASALAAIAIVAAAVAVLQRVLDR